MASAQQIIALLNSHVQGDQEQFLSIALQVAAGEARAGRRDTADQLRRLVQKARIFKGIRNTNDLTRNNYLTSNSLSKPHV